VIFGKGNAVKKNYVSTLVWVIAGAALLALPANCAAQDSQQEQKAFWSEPERGARWVEPSDEMIERVMKRLGETDPEKAEQLRQLREQDPEKFKTEIREVMREHLRARHREGMEPGDPGERPRFQRRRPPEGERPGKVGRGRQPRPAQERHREFLEWLGKNYPEEARKLAKLREQKSDDYDARLGLMLKKYRRVFEAVKEHPELAKLLKEDLELKQERDQLLRRIRRAKDEAVKTDLSAQLEQVVSKRFDLIVQRKQMEYEQLLKRLENLKKQVEESEGEVTRWKQPDFKDRSVKARVEELVSAREDFKWE
jgi:hypothetical protein